MGAMKNIHMDTEVERLREINAELLDALKGATEELSLIRFDREAVPSRKFIESLETTIAKAEGRQP